MDFVGIGSAVLSALKDCLSFFKSKTHVVDIGLTANSAHTKCAEWICNFLRCAGYKGVVRKPDNTIVVKFRQDQAETDLEFLAAGLQRLHKVQYTHDPGPLAEKILMLFCDSVLTKSEAKDLFDEVKKLANVNDEIEIRRWAKKRLA